MLCESVDLSSFPSSGMRIQEHEVGSHLPTPFTFRNGPSKASGFEGTRGGTNLGALIRQLEDLKLVCHHPSDNDLDTYPVPGSSQFLI